MATESKAGWSGPAAETFSAWLAAFNADPATPEAFMALAQYIGQRLPPR